MLRICVLLAGHLISSYLHQPQIMLEVVKHQQIAKDSFTMAKEDLRLTPMPIHIA